MKPNARISRERRLRRQSLSVVLLFTGLILLAQGRAQPRPFTVHDTDADGYLSREEYRVLLEMRRARHYRRGRLAPQPAADFDEIDRDRDGRIGEQELTDALPRRMRRYRHGGPPFP